MWGLGGLAPAPGPVFGGRLENSAQGANATAVEEATETRATRPQQETAVAEISAAENSATGKDEL